MIDFKDYQAAFIDHQTDLAHHGIKGMHWGVRRYQNPDGSLTLAGMKRYNKNAKFRNKMDNDPKYQEHKKKMEEVDKHLEESRKILQKEVYEADNKKLTKLAKEYYKDQKQKGRTDLTEEQFVNHMFDDGWQDDADEWYLRKYHNRSL